MSTNSLLKSVGIHEKKLRKYFQEFDIPKDRKPAKFRTAILIFSNRSGSSMIGEYLRATGAVSGLGEPLNYDTVIKRCEKHGLTTFEQYLDWLVDHVRQPDSQFGMKASFDQVLMLMRCGALPRMFLYVRWIFVQRVDLLSQAISYSIADQTQQWQSFRDSNGLEPEYDFKAIQSRLMSISDTYAASLTMLNLLGISPHFITYEQFLEDPEARTAEIARFLGVKREITIHSDRLKLKKQASATNEAFRKRFLKDILGGQIRG